MRRSGLKDTHGRGLKEPEPVASSIQQLVSRQSQEFDEVVGDDHVVHQPRGFGDVGDFGEQADLLVEPLFEQIEA